MNSMKYFCLRKDKRNFFRQFLKFIWSPVGQVHRRFVKMDFQVSAKLAQARERIFNFFEVDENFFSHSVLISSSRPTGYRWTISFCSKAISIFIGGPKREKAPQGGRLPNSLYDIFLFTILQRNKNAALAAFFRQTIKTC
jgi:hypothetical protein